MNLGLMNPGSLRASVATVLVVAAGIGSASAASDGETSEPRVRPLSGFLSGDVVYPMDRVLKLSFDVDWGIDSSIDEGGPVTYLALAPSSVTLDLESVDPAFDIDRITFAVDSGARVVQHLAEPVVVLEGVPRNEAAGIEWALPGLPAQGTYSTTSASGMIFASGGGWHSLTTTGSSWGQAGLGGGCVTKSCSLPGSCGGSVQTDAGSHPIDGKCGRTSLTICNGVLSVD